jgi:hypothetical protein
MAEAIILEFEGRGIDDYNRVNEALGLDMETGGGDWPEGLLSHTGAGSADGLLVFEVWDSRESQERFMDERLAAALQAGGIAGPPTRMEWLDLAAHRTPGA